MNLYKIFYHPVTQFFFALPVLVVAQHVVLYIISFFAGLSPGDFHCGEDLLHTRQKELILFFSVSGIFLLQLFPTIEIFRKKLNPSVAYASMVALILPLAYSWALSPSLNDSNYITPVSAKEWKEKKQKPVEMARYLILNEVLQGKSQREVFTQWGSGYGYADSNYIFYPTDAYNTDVYVEFDDSKTVKDVYLKCRQRY